MINGDIPNLYEFWKSVEDEVELKSDDDDDEGFNDDGSNDNASDYGQSSVVLPW